MIATPWGRSDQLKSRKLPPGPGASREEVETNQRERLFGAMVAAVAQHGYEKTRVADVLELSGVSRNTFYKHFSNKQQCFLATLDAIAAIGSDTAIEAYASHPGPWNERLAAAFDRLIQTIVESPEIARLYYVEAYAAGPEAIERVERVGNRLERITRQAFDESPEHAGMPRDVLRAVVRAFRQIIQTRLRHRREQELVDLAPQLLDWGLSYRPPPESLRRPRKPPARFASPRREPQTARERILAAVVELIAEDGYEELTVMRIAQRASVSLTTFYAEFENKEAAVLKALRRAARMVFETVAPAYRQAEDWPHGVAEALHAFFALLVREPSFARFGGVGVHLGSPIVVELRLQVLAGAQAFLAEGYREHPGVSPIAGEAIGASVDSLLFDQVRGNGEHRLYEIAPTATFIALAPFVGVERACAIANASRK